MEFTGKLLNTGLNSITFSVDDPEAIKAAEGFQNGEKLLIKADKYKSKRSLDANRLLWSCIGDLAAALNADKWDIYLQMLRRYGRYAYICIKPEAVPDMKQRWRECEEIGETFVNGEKMVQLICYFGSSTYDTQEFSRLINGVVSEMKEMKLSTPPSLDMKRILEQVGR